MNDEPTPGAPQGAGSTDPLDDTQRVDVPRYAPTPDPRPDARWAWAAPGTQPQGERWQQPSPTEPPSGARSAWGSTATTPPPAYSAPVQPATGAPSKRRTGAGVGTVVTASLLSAVLAAGGTAVVLDRTGALDRGITQSPTGSTQQTGAQQPVTIDESSAVIDAAAKAGPAVVKITTTSGAGDTSPFGNPVSNRHSIRVVFQTNRREQHELLELTEEAFCREG